VDVHERDQIGKDNFHNEQQGLPQELIKNTTGRTGERRPDPKHVGRHQDWRDCAWVTCE
jgi:hypothetical protein